MKIDRHNCIGERFGRLVINAVVGSGPDKHIIVECLCDCGGKTQVPLSRLKNKNIGTKSCGCLTKIVNTTHGKRSSKMYPIWIGMKQRCTNPKNKRYSDYGGRGITVCDSWQNFENFLADMGEAPEGLTIDRINNDGDYEPGNCRWISMKEQARNYRHNHILSYNGKEKPLVAWAEQYNIPYHTLKSRINKLHWPVDKALNTPVRESHINIITN